MKRKGEWHSAWGSAVEDRRCERGHKQASKSLQGAHSFCLDLLLAASMTSRLPARRALRAKAKALQCVTSLTWDRSGARGVGGGGARVFQLNKPCGNLVLSMRVRLRSFD